jgi:tetratricopeptide (TPR) repeat protein
VGKTLFKLGAGAALFLLALHAQGVPAGLQTTWRQYLDIGQRLYSKGLYDAAEEAFRGAVKEAEALKSSDVPLGTALARLGLFYHVQRRYPEAHEAYQNALAVLSVDPDAAPREYALVLGHLADLDVAERHPSDAWQLYQRCVEVIETKIGSQERILINPLQGWARLAVLEGNHDEAVRLAERAFLLIRNQRDPSVPEVVETAEIVGTAYSRSGDYMKAESVLSDLLGLAHKVFGETAPETGRIGERLAGVYRERLQFAEAEALMRQRLSGFTEDPSEALATTLNNLAEYLLAQESFEEAEALLLRSLRIRQSLSSDDDPELAVTLHNLASLYADQGRTDEARKALSQALRICEKSLPPEHSETSSIRELYQKLGDAAQPN